MEQSVANLVDMRDVSFTRGNRCIFDNISRHRAAREDHGDHGAIGHR